MKKNIYRNTMIILFTMLLVFPLQAVTSYAAEPIPESMYYPSDIENHWAFAELDNFINADLLRGYVDETGDVTVKPNQSISRAEFVTILVRSLGLTNDKAGTAFTDVQQGKWYAEPVRIASAQGIVSGTSATTFGPNEPVKRGEIAALIVRAFSSSVEFTGEAKQFTDVPDYFATQDIKKASQVGIVQGDTATTFKPFANATRAEAVVMVQRALDLQSSDLPEDSMLTKLITDWTVNNAKAVNDKAFDQLTKLDKQYTTGYQLAYNSTVNEEFKKMIEDGVSLSSKQLSEEKLKVIAKTNRFAVVESKDGMIEITTKANGTEAIVKQSTDGHYLLKKMQDNSWKIYMTIYDDQQK